MDGPQQPRVFAVVPVFERLDHTLACIAQLRAQSYPNVEIVIVDGGSRDGSLEALEELDGITLIAHVGEQWWTGATWYGIDHALKTGTADDLVLLLNDDTVFDASFVEVLVDDCREHGAAIGATIVDADDPVQVLDAGVTIDWRAYGFHTRREIGADELNFDVDTLEGRGALVPLAMIRHAGTVDPHRLPHYVADFELFCRIKRHGNRLAVTGRTRLGAHQGTTGLFPTNGTTSGQGVWAELAARRSMTNVRDQLAFVDSAAPPELRSGLKRALVVASVVEFAKRTPTAQRLRLPAVVRFLRRAEVFVVRPYPFTDDLAPPAEIEAAIERDIVSPYGPRGWYDFRPRVGVVEARRGGAGSLWLKAWNPLTKPRRWRAFAAASEVSGASG